MPLSSPINCFVRHAEFVGIISSISNPVRWTILRTVFLHGPQSQEKLARYLQVTPSSLSRHIHILVDSHLIEMEKVGKRNMISPSPTAHRILTAALPISAHQPGPEYGRE